MKLLSMFGSVLLLVTLWATPIAAQNRQLVAATVVYFDRATALLDPTAQQHLTQWLDTIRRFPSAELHLEGSTDPDGTVAANQRLATQRAQSVQDFLTKNGIKNPCKTTVKIPQTATTNDQKVKSRCVSIQVWTIAPPPNPQLAAQKYRAYQNLMVNAVSPTQMFTVPTNQPSMIRGKEGTVITFPAEAFAGVPAGATVNFMLKENYRFSTMIADNLTTTSDGQMLQTGGMIYTEATFKGQSLQLQKQIQVTFNSPESQLPDMQAFVGKRDWNNDGQINWKPVGGRIETPRTETATYLMDGKTFIPYFIPVAEDKYSVMDFQMALDTGGGASALRDYRLGRFQQTSSKTVEAMIAYLETVKPNDAQTITAPALHKRVFWEMYSFYNINQYEDLKRQDPSRWNTRLADWYKHIPRERTEAEEIDRLVSSGLDTSIFMPKYREKKQWRAEKPMREKFGKMAEQFGLYQLGWLNCDRYTKAQLLTLSLTKLTTRGTNSNLNRYFLIMPSQNGIIHGYGKEIVAFSDVEVGTNVRLLVFDYKDGKYYFAIKDLKVEKDMPMIEYTLVETNPDAIKEQLAVLDKK